MRYLIITVVTVTLMSFAPVRAQDDSIPTLTEAEKLYGLSLFWKEVSYNFAFFHQVPDLNWDSAYQAFIPRVIATENTYDYYREMQRFCALLRDGHTNINFPASIRKTLSYPKLLQAEIDHRMFIRNVDTGLAAAIPIGTEILKIDGRPAIEFVQQEVMPYRSISAEHVLWDMGVRGALYGKRGTRVTLAIRRPDGSDTTVTLVRDRTGVAWLRPFPNKPLASLKWLDDGIAHVELTSFGDKAIVTQFEEFLPELYKARGVIIDLRSNGGGSTSTGTAILEQFTSDSLWGSMWQTRQHIAAYKAWASWAHSRGEESDYMDYYLGNAWFGGDTWLVVPDSGKKIKAPVVVLFGRNTGSAAEDFLIYADEVEHFTFVGEPSNGSTGQPLLVENFPGGGMVRICSKRDTYRDGRDFVGYGVQPDVLVHQTVQSLIDESDPVLDKGIEVLREKLK